MEDIRVTQLSSTQMAAQIRMVQGSNNLACEKLRAALETTIPLWKSQMAAALGLARATETIAMHRQTEKDAMRGMYRGARELRAQGEAYAKVCYMMSVAWVNDPDRRESIREYFDLE